jgi:putative redox protein
MREVMMPQTQPGFPEFYAEDLTRFPRVAATFAGDEQVDVQFSMRDLLIDHPTELGGTGAGPSPGELLLAALAACTSVYVGRNAKRFGIPLESVHVGTSFEIGHEPTEGPLDSVSYLKRITKRVEIRGPLSGEQLDAIRFWVEHCAIGETLRRGVELVEEVIVVTDPNQLPFGGRSPRCEGAADDKACCTTGDVLTGPDQQAHGAL